MNAPPPDQDWEGIFDDGQRMVVLDWETGRTKTVELEDEGELTGSCVYGGHGGQRVVVDDGSDASAAGGDQ